MSTPFVLDVEQDTHSKRDSARQGRLRVGFYTAVAAALLLIVVIGFSPTFFLRVFFDVPPVPSYVFFHGALLTLWFSGLVVQTLLVSARRTRIHQRFGWGVVVVGVTLVAVTGPVILNLAPRQRALGAVIDARVIRLVWLDLAILAGFAVFFALAVLMRHRLEWHKRLMLLASVTIVSPALGRAWNLIPGLRPFNATLVTSGLLFALIALALHDLFSTKRIHPATLSGAAFLMALRALAPVIAASEFGQRFVRGLG